MNPLRKVVSELCVGHYTALQLDGELPSTSYTKYLIDGKYYDAVPVYDLPRHIAIEATGSFIDKTVEFV